MKQKREFPFTVGTAGGRIPAETMQAIINVLQGFPGKRMKISLSQVRKRRSDPQNRFYWGVVVPLVTKMFVDYGNEVDGEDVHRFLKGKVGGMTKPIVDKGGEVITWVVETSTKLTTYEWEVWMEQIRAWAASIDLFIPMPNEEYQLEVAKQPKLAAPTLCGHRWTTSTNPKDNSPVNICADCGEIKEVENAEIQG